MVGGKFLEENFCYSKTIGAENPYNYFALDAFKYNEVRLVGLPQWGCIAINWHYITSECVSIIPEE